MYLDDIKVFAQNDQCLQILVDTIRMFSDDIGMRFGFQNVQNCLQQEANQIQLALYHLWMMKFMSLITVRHNDIWGFLRLVV